MSPTPSNLYRKKPVVIASVQILQVNKQALYELVDVCADVDIVDIAGKVLCVRVRTCEGTMTGQLGDWLIRGVKGEFYPCRPDVFEMTYDKVESDD